MASLSFQGCLRGAVEKDNIRRTPRAGRPRPPPASTWARAWPFWVPDPPGVSVTPRDRYPRASALIEARGWGNSCRVRRGSLGDVQIEARENLFVIAGGGSLSRGQASYFPQGHAL